MGKRLCWKGELVGGGGQGKANGKHLQVRAKQLEAVWRGLHGYQLGEGAAGSRLQSSASRLADACYFLLTTTTSYFSHIIARVQIYFTFIISPSYFSQFITRVQATSHTSLIEDKAFSYLSSLEYKLEVIVTRRSIGFRCT